TGSSYKIIFGTGTSLTIEPSE
uniref:Uncharacterized protein n=1 Tax=Gasterosteus aculeatus aculeatus TaxID=481459 RepID=A0AAQ4RRX1_GASAC